MSEHRQIPNYLMPVYQLANDGVEVVNTPSGPQTDEDGKTKQNQAFPGMQAYRVGVEVVYSEREVIRDGEPIIKASTKLVNVTVWASSMPQVQVGDLVRFTSLMVGAMESHVFAQALGVEVISND